LKEKFENKKLNTSDSKHNIPTYMSRELQILRLMPKLEKHDRYKRSSLFLTEYEG
jgi:hypothetical protein